MSPSRARLTNSNSSVGLLFGGSPEGSSDPEPPGALPEAGSIIVSISKIALGTNSQMVCLAGEVFRQTFQTGVVRRFGQDVQALPRLFKILVDDFQRIGQCVVPGQEFQHRRKAARLPVLDQSLQARPVPGA